MSAVVVGAQLRRSMRGKAKRAVVSTKRAVFGTLGGRAPDWIIAGAMKAGTTSLHYALHRSRQAVLPAKKEVHYFDYNWPRGDGWYHSHFVPVAGMRTGEASPSYMFHPAAAGRMASSLPDVRLIVLLRDPVDRAYSHWAHEVRAGLEPLGFAEAVEAEPERLREVDPDDPRSPHRHFSYVTRGCYADQLERLFECFDRDRVLVLRAEDVFDDFPGGVARICGWLGLAVPAARRYSRRNVGLERPPIDETLRRHLAQRLAAANRALPALAGSDMRW